MQDTPVYGTQTVGDLATKVLDSLTAAVAVLDSSGTIRATNEAWRRFAVSNGGSPNTTGVGVNYLDVCQQASGEDLFFAEKACKGIRDVLAGTCEVFKLEYPCHSLTEQRWFLLHVSPLKDGGEHVVTTHLPITERKLIEQQLVAAERLAAIGQAMQGLSHEGRNSLQRAQGCIDLLRCHIEQDAEAVELLERIERAQRRLIGLYEEVRTYAAPINLQRVSYPLNELIEEVWATIAPRDGRIQFCHVPAPMNLACDVDVDAIRRILRSVFVNAISADVGASVVEVSYSNDEIKGRPAVTMIVSDDGSGIAEARREKVFEPFFTTKTRGTGLGLASCRRLTEAHGGQISITAATLGGASVRLTLPESR